MPELRENHESSSGRALQPAKVPELRDVHGSKIVTACYNSSRMGKAALSKEKRHERLSIVLRTHKNVSRLLAKEKSREKLIHGICRTLVEDRGYYNAWIVLIDSAGVIEEWAQTGVGDTFRTLIEDWKTRGIPDCGKRAMDTPGVVLTGSPRTECRDCALSADYGGRGAMASRLEHEGKIFGLLCVSTPKELLAEREEVELIEEAARDIAAALSGIEAEEKKNRAEKLLKESDDRYRSVFENTGTAVLIIENDKTISMVNTQFEKLSGYSKTEIEGSMKWTDFVTEEDQPRMLEYHVGRRRRSEDIPTEYEFRFVAKGGERKDIFCKIGMIPGTKTSVASWIDITSLRRAEKALQYSEKQFRDLIENSLMGISMIQDGRVLYRNPEQRRLFGPLSESTHPFNMENVHPDDKENVQRLYRDLVTGKSKSFQTEFRFFPSEKSEIAPTVKWVDCRANLITYKGKDAILTNMLDMTRAKELEHFMLMQDKMASLGHLAAGIAHEIRNPLSGINIYLNTLEKMNREMDRSDKADQIIEQIKSASRRIESVIRRVMDFSRPGEPKVVLGSINKPIRDAVELASVTLRKSDIRMDTILAEDLPDCWIDPHMMEEVLLNLITNAAAAMNDSDKEKRIEISSSWEAGFVVVKVSDSGPGVPYYHRDKIFDPFYTTKSDSSGIGLSITHRIVSDHGGSVQVGSSHLGGAEFRVKIPVETGRENNDQI